MAHVLVIAVEEPGEIRVEQPVAGHEFAEDERLKEPCGVGKVPLGRRGLGDGLHHHVLRRERLAERKGPAADRTKPLANLNFRTTSGCCAHGVPSRLETSVSRPDHFSTFCPTNEGSGNFARGIFVFRWSNVLWPNAGRRRFAGFVRIPSMRREYVELETAPPFDGFRSSGSHLDAVARRHCPCTQSP